MSGPNFYFITSLPTLRVLGEAPPLPPEAILDYLADSPAARELLATIFLSQDLLQREAYLAGELKEVSPAVLTVEQVRNKAPLPDYLTPAGAVQPRRVPIDAVWEAYFRHAASVATRLGSAFLEAWVRYEVGLRNALTTARAQSLGLEPADYLVASDLGAPHQEYDQAIGEWSAAPDPLAAMGALQRSRWDWLMRNDAYYSFDDDELAAYGAKLTLMASYYRLVLAQQRQQ